MIEKEIQRKTAQAARRAIPETERAEYNAAICTRLVAHPTVCSASVILSYMAFAGEADLTAFHDWARAAGKTLAFPVAYEEGRMEAYIPGAWETDQFGILAPVADRSVLVEPTDIDLVLAPCVAFDSERNRLGWSGGYYDRYLPRCVKAVKFAVAYEIQKMSRIADVQPWDVPVDAIATEINWY